MPVPQFSKLCSCTTPVKIHARRPTLDYCGLITCTTSEHFFRFQCVIFFSVDFDLIAVIVLSFCVSTPHFTNIGSFTAEIWRFIDIQDGGRCGAILLLYRIFEKVSVYQHTTYRQDNSIHGRDITFSVLQKQTSAILKYFFRFWLWPHHRNPYDTGILHKVARLHLYRTTQCRNMTSHRFFKMAAAAVQYYFRFSTC